MEVHYIAPSTLPSRTANSVHVIMQCDGLRRAGARVTLYARRAMSTAAELPVELARAYGLDAGSIALRTCYSRYDRASTLRIAAMAVPQVLRLPRETLVLSRNLYAAFALAVLARRPLLFETHQLEFGVRKELQRQLIAAPHVKTVLISSMLVRCLAEHHGIVPRAPLVLHDAASEGIDPIAPDQRRTTLVTLGIVDAHAWDLVCAYFGQLYAGRGIEVIEQLASARPRNLFLVYGGNDPDIGARRASAPPPNLRFMGHVPHPLARRAMTAADALLMPYQPEVSIGSGAHDTGRWMSPMKMFEYMAAGVPLISSDLPVLREVLREGENCLFAAHDDVGAWLRAIDFVRDEPSRAQALGATAHVEYRAHHTWTQRGKALLAAWDPR